MQKRTHKTEVLQTFVGKRIEKIHLSTSHGDVLEVQFEDGSTIAVCTTKDLVHNNVEFDPDDLFITANDQPVFEYGPKQ